MYAYGHAAGLKWDCRSKQFLNLQLVKLAIHHVLSLDRRHAQFYVVYHLKNALFGAVAHFRL